MDNLWLLTEERPKPSVIMQIIEMYCTDFNDRITEHSEIKVKPQINEGVFDFVYVVEGLTVANADNVYIKTVSGSSSFLDFLLFKQKEAPTEGNQTDNLIMAIEETKTSDDESRNTGVYQRGSKFVYITPYYNHVKLYMLYNEELEAREHKKPSDTSIFGTNILLTLGAIIVGKNISRWFKPFESLDELISFKAGMRQPPSGNVPIMIRKYEDRIEISGRLAKPADAGNIGHDPNIGALSMISSCIRKLGWEKDIVITLHGVTQQYVNNTCGKNKFLYICNILGIRLDGITMPINVVLPDLYWHYERRSEKMADILLHIQTVYHGMFCVYENHAGCERGYFRTKTGRLVTLPKKDRNGVNLYLPDVVLYDEQTNYILLVEGKMLSTWFCCKKYADFIIAQTYPLQVLFLCNTKNHINQFYFFCNRRCASLTFPNHTHGFYTLNGRAGRFKVFESQHMIGNTLNISMVLFNNVVHVFGRTVLGFWR